MFVTFGLFFYHWSLWAWNRLKGLRLPSGRLDLNQLSPDLSRTLMGVVLSAALLGAWFLSTARAAGESPPIGTGPTPIMLNVTREQALVFLNALHFELSPNSGKVYVKEVPSSQMPAYDPVAHYAGIQNGAPLVIVCSPLPNNKTSVKRAIGDAMALAVMDDGEAGPLWKNMYDDAAKTDAGLPPDAPDPYLHRHALANAALSLMQE